MQAQELGIPLLRLEDNTPHDFKGHSDFSRVLNAINKKIDGGQLKLGRGDVLNISKGSFSLPDQPDSGDPTFEQASKILGMKITADNLKEMRPLIIERAAQLARDHKQPTELRQTFQRIIDTNAAIDRLQAKGIEVVHAAGNDGPERFSWDFMNARHQMSGLLMNGKPSPQSARHSLTTDGNQEVPIRYQPVNLLDPKPVAEQMGGYTIGNTEARVPAEAFGGTRFDRSYIKYDGASGDQVLVRPSSVSQDTFVPAPMGDGHGLQNRENGRERIIMARNCVTTPYALSNSHATNGKAARMGFSEEEKIKGLLVDVASGTSFANIDFLKGQYERLRRLKAVLRQERRHQ